MLADVSKGFEFYDGWEQASYAEREQTIRQRLQEYIHYARSETGFYKERLESFDPQATHPLSKVPCLSSAQVRELLPPLSNELVARSAGPYTVFQSGGTTGLPKTTLFSHEELEGLNLPNSRGFYGVHLSKEDRVANLWAVGSLYMTFVHINRMLQQYGCTNFPLSNHTSSEFIHTVVKAYGINCLTGIASVVLNALRGMEAYGLEGIQIDKVYFGGEHLYDADYRELRDKFGVKTIAAPAYGTVDTWYLGYQCEKCPNGVFHAQDDQVYLEIVREDPTQHCEGEEIGMLLATAYPRRVTPIVRYQVGDRAHWFTDPCDCGRTTPRFRLLGRGDDVLRIGYDSVDYRFVQEQVTEVKGLLGSIQMEKRRLEGKDQLIVRVETDEPTAHHAGLATHLEQRILSKRPSLTEFMKKGTVHPLVVEIVEAGSLPRNSRTGKLIRVIDAI